MVITFCAVGSPADGTLFSFRCAVPYRMIGAAQFSFQNTAFGEANTCTTSINPYYCSKF